MKKDKALIKSRKLLVKIERKSLELCTLGQMTSHLYALIRKAMLDSDFEKMALLKELSEDTLRVRGYYHKHKEEEHNSNLYIDDKVAKFEKERRKVY